MALSVLVLGLSSPAVAVAATGFREVTGRVLQSVGGAPAPHCMYLRVESADVSAALATDSLGEFDVSLPPGDYEIVGTCAGWFGARFTVGNAAVNLGDVVPLPTVAISGRVSDEHGVAISGANVSFNAGPYFAGPSVSTGADGRYSTALPAGSYDVWTYVMGGALSANHRTFSVGASAVTGLDLTLYHPVAVSGHVTEGGASSADAHVTVSGDNGWDSGAVGSDGSYSLSVPPGHYEVSAGMNTGPRGAAPVALDLVAGTPATVDFDIPVAGGALAGRVATDSGAPVEEGTLAHAISGGDRTDYLNGGTVAADGAFSLDDLALGGSDVVAVNRASGQSLYTGRFYAGSGKLGAARFADATRVSVTAASKNLGAVKLDTCGTAHGRVVDPASVYFAGFDPATDDMTVAVFNDDDADLVTRTAPVAADGTFAVTGLLPGSYYAVLRVAQSGTGIYRYSEVPFGGVVSSSGSPNVVVGADCGEVQGVNFNVPQVVASSSQVVGVTPVRLADFGLLAGFGASQCVSVAGAGAPVGAAGVLVNVASVNPGSAGNVVVFPSDGSAHPTAPTGASVNFEQGSTVANAAWVKVGADGKICAFSQSFAPSRVVLDVSGFAMGDSGLTLAASQRLVDTRSAGTAAGMVGGLVARQVHEVQVGGVLGVPADAKAVVLNVAAVSPAGVGNLRVFPATGTQVAPDVATVNYAPGQTKSNAAVVPLGVDGKVGLYSDTFSASPVQVVLDVTGYVAASGSYQTVSPTRVLDTRPGAPGSVHGLSTLHANQGVAFDVRGTAVVPDGATGVLLNVTAIHPSTVGNLRVYPDSDGTGATAPPGASQINYITGRDIPNLVLAKIPADGTIMLYSNQPTGGTVDLAIDVIGYTTG